MTVWTIHITAFQDPYEKAMEFVRQHRIVFDYYKIHPHTGGFTVEIVKNNIQIFNP